jgi:hypothetical protein
LVLGVILSACGRRISAPPLVGRTQERYRQSEIPTQFITVLLLI